MKNLKISLFALKVNSSAISLTCMKITEINRRKYFIVEELEYYLPPPEIYNLWLCEETIRSKFLLLLVNQKIVVFLPFNLNLDVILREMIGKFQDDSYMIDEKQIASRKMIDDGLSNKGTV